MKFEHFALNVPDARAMGRWYIENLGLRAVRSRDDAPYTKFLADDTGRVVIEIYTNPAAAIPDYGAANPLCFHVAFIAENAAAVRQRLEKAGAKFASEDKLSDGSHLIIMRDPWGVPLQFCQRATPLA